MEIQFDQGTIIAKPESGGRFDLNLKKFFAESFYWKWDPRICAYRAPAFKLYSFLAEIKSLDFQCKQNISSKHSHLIEINVPPLELRHYQQEALNHWDLQGRRGVVVLPTGAGKTRLALHCIWSTKAKTLVLVPTRVLLHQWREEISTRFKMSVGILGDGQHQIADITIATFESAIRSAGTIGDKFKFLIIDEAHHFLGGERIEIVEMFCAPYCLSLSATFSYSPEQHGRVISLLGPIVFQLSVEDLKGSVLAPFQKFLILVNLGSVERKIYDNLMTLFHETLGAVKSENIGLHSSELFILLGRSTKGKRALSSLREARRIISICDEKIKRISELLIRFRDRKILIFTPDTLTTIKISSELLVFPILAETSKAERAIGLELFIEGKIGALVTCRVLNEGFDVPSADMAIVVGGSHGEREHIQRIGRVLRSAPGKSALIYELVCRDTIEVKQWRKRNSYE